MPSRVLFVPFALTTKSCISGLGGQSTDGARLLVAGIGVDWRHGLGATRAELTERARCPLLLVRRGLRPGGLLPRETLTRFKWSLSGGGARE